MTCITITTYYIGCVIGNWAAILPFVKDEQHISNGLLGLILISAIGGALLALPIITYLNDHYGSGLSTIIGSIVMLIFYPIVGINYHLGILITGIFLLGTYHIVPLDIAFRCMHIYICINIYEYNL